MASIMDKRCKTWSEEIMVAATKSVLHDNKGMRAIAKRSGNVGRFNQEYGLGEHWWSNFRK